MEKNLYNAPTVKVVSFKVEVGSQTSQDMYIGITEGLTINPAPDPEAYPASSEGTELFGIRSL